MIISLALAASVHQSPPSAREIEGNYEVGRHIPKTPVCGGLSLQYEKRQSAARRPSTCVGRRTPKRRLYTENSVGGHISTTAIDTASNGTKRFRRKASRLARLPTEYRYRSNGVATRSVNHVYKDCDASLPARVISRLSTLAWFPDAGAKWLADAEADAHSDADNEEANQNLNQKSVALV
jgi:hypothetical protein